MSKEVLFDFSTVSPQLFPFPPDVIKYMIKNCNGPAWLKLIKSCKYFHCKRKALVLKSTTFDARGCITATDRSIHRFWESVDKLPCELFLAGKLTISAPLTLFKPKILSCKLRELNIVKVTLGIKEFEYLVDSEILDTFCVKNAEIRYSDESVVPLEELFEGIPNVTCLSFDSHKAVNAHTFRRMAETSRNRKLISYDFTGIRNIKEEDFVLFTQNHAARNCKIILGAIPQPLINALNKMLAKWGPQSGKPTINFSPFVIAPPPLPPRLIPPVPPVPARTKQQDDILHQIMEHESQIEKINKRFEQNPEQLEQELRNHREEFQRLMKILQLEKRQF